MLLKSTDVHYGFYDEFLSGTTDKMIDGDSLNTHPMLPIQLGNGDMQDFLIRYFHRSGESPAEETKEWYPCIAIQKFSPMIDYKMIYGKDWVEGAVDKAAGTRQLITLPVPMVCKYQVSLICKRDREQDAGNDWFMSRFNMQRTGFFLFNKVDTPNNGTLGDVVRYTCEIVEVPREDNRLETAYTFTLYPFVHLLKPVSQEYINKISVHLTQRNMVGVTSLLTEIITITENGNDN